MPGPELSPEVHRYFHLFWDNFPFPVLLLRKDRTILDRNRAAEEVGSVPGTRCVEQGPREAHKGCLGNQALDEQKTQRVVGHIEGYDRIMDTYWIPLPGHEDVFVHFGIDITDYAAERLFPKACGGAAGCGSCAGA